MLIVPMTEKLNWRNPPWITLLLIFLNCFIFFAFQITEFRKTQEYMEFYFSSGLGKIETTEYLKYKNELKEGQKVTNTLMIRTYQRMMKDDAFIQKLESAQIITSASPVYGKWKDLRATFLKMKSDTFSLTEKYGYRPATGSILTAFTCMFLHGGFLHLLGNMIFLWLVGCSLELVAMRPAYLVIYISAGAVAALFFGLIYSGNTVPLVGASGAIAGIIGAYTVLFGLRKVKIFLSLGFYFNYMKVRAIFLLPVWIGNELFQLKWGGESNVAYAAHIGGLLWGSALALAQLKLLGGIKADAFADSKSETIASLVEQAMGKLGVLDLAAARSLVHEALALDPENRTALTCLFNIEKLAPQSEEFHNAAERLLLSHYRDMGDCKALHSLYKEYCDAAVPPRLTPDMCAKLSQAFSDGGFLEDSRKLAAFLHRKAPQFPAMPATLLKLSRAYIRSGIEEDGRKCLRLLCRQYPETEESRLAKQILDETPR